MTIKEKIAKINAYIRQNEWFDFSLQYLSSSEAIILGGKDLQYYHELEVIFSDVFYVSLCMDWKSAPSRDVLHLVEGQDAYEFNVRFNVLEGNSVFEFVIEDNEEDYYVVAKGLDYSFDTVYHYKRANLKEGERLADWIV